MPEEKGKREKEQEQKEFYEAYDWYRDSVKDGYIFIMTTEEIDFCKVGDEKIPKEKLFEKGLEIRIFNEDREAKWFRTGIRKHFAFREIQDDEKAEKDNLLWWDESQYLDIDEKETKKSGRKGEVCATGGGIYRLPLEVYTNAKIRIRNYLEEDRDTGELYVKDWRMVGFGEWEV